MNRFLFIFVLAVFIVTMPLTALASRRTDIEDILDDWTDYLEDEDYLVEFTEIEELAEGTHVVRYTIEFEEGDWLVIAEGDRNIEDLNMAVWFEDDWEDGDDPIDQDWYDDNYPMCEFELDDEEILVVEIWVEEFTRREDEGYICVLMAKED